MIGKDKDSQIFGHLAGRTTSSLFLSRSVSDAKSTMAVEKLLWAGIDSDGFFPDAVYLPANAMSRGISGATLQGQYY